MNPITRDPISNTVSYTDANPADSFQVPLHALKHAYKEATESLQQVSRWVEAHNYKGYEPFDGLSSWLRPLTFRNLFFQRLLQQFVRQSPTNLRPLLGVHPKDSTKGRGYMAHGYLLHFRTTQDERYLQRAVECLHWLDRHKVPRFRHHSWSNHYDFAGRGGIYTSNDPIIVWTSLIGNAFVEAFSITHESWFLDIADSACQWILQLPREHTLQGDCISYLASKQSSIHNANMLGAALLAQVAMHTGNTEYLNVARSAMRYSCSAQLPSGAWWYAEDPIFHWIDNFHTGYNLDSLDTYLECSGDHQYRESLARGIAFYKEHFFETTGRPQYYATRTYPVDIQCIAQSIDTLARFSDRDPDCLALAIKVTQWAIGNMQGKDGHFYYRQYPLFPSRTPMLHWGQATMFKALCNLALRLDTLIASATPNEIQTTAPISSRIPLSQAHGTAAVRH